MATANHVLLQRITVTAPVSSVTFDVTNLSGYTDLKIVLSARTDAASVQQSIVMKVNSLTSGYLDKFLYGSGSAAGSGSLGTTIGFVGDAPAANATANTFGNQEIYIPNYKSSVAKSWSIDSVAETNASAAYMELTAGYNSTTSAITTINLGVSSGNLVAGSSFAVYGIANTATTPVSAPKADGGDIIKTDGTYWYHTFVSSGIFKPQVGLTCDYLVVAGGGGAGSGAGGGGGAGGFRTSTGNSLTAISYLVTVGAGGAGGASGAANRGLVGSDSVFNGLTSTGGGFGGAHAQSIAAGNGGSGGGAGGGGNSNNTAGTGTSGQGNNGGTAFNTSGAYGGGAGGGAGAVGGNGSSTAGGNGGNGTANSYSGTSVTYAGGGGAGTYSGGGGTFNGGTGGTGGGGNAATTTNGSGASGTANLGGGGGGGTYTSAYGAGGSGGSGVVIIRYAV